MAKRKRRRNLRYLPSIQAEQQRQAAQLANPNDPVDATAFFQNLPPSLRQAILTDMEDSQIASLPPDLVAEATVATAGSSNRAETTPLTSVAAAAAAREAEIQRRDQKKFMEFVETHRTVLNQILRQSATHLSDGLFSVLVDHPRILDFDMKRKYFRTELEHMDEEVRREELTVNVRRVTAFEDSFRGLYRRGPEEWKNRIYIVCEDEEGQEAGGLLREWYIIILREIFNPMYALFCVSPGDRVTYMINPSSHANPNHLCYFKFVGRVLVKAIHDNKLLDCFFARSFFKHILGIQVKYTDMESQDYEFYKGLAYLMSNDISTIGFDLTFSTEVQEFGVTQICSDIFTITRRPLGGGSSTAAASASAALSNTLDLTINDRMPSRNSASRTSVRSIATDPKELETTDSVALEGAELKAATAGSSNKVETTPSTSVAHTAAAREADIQCRDQKKFLEIAEKHHTRKYFRSELEGMDEGARRFFVFPVKLPSIFTVTGCKNFNKAAVSFSMIFEKMYISLLFRMSLADNTNLKKMEQLKKRGTRVSKTQKESMIMFMLENKDFARGQISTAEGSRCTQELWAILSKRLNSLGPNIKTIDQWKKCWTDIKSTTKTKWTSRKKFLYGTGGGSSSDGPPDLTEMDEKVMEIITISAVDGDGSTPEITGETQIMSVEVELPQEMEEEVFTLATPKKAPDYVKSAFEEAKGMHDSLQNTLDEIKQQIATLVSQNEKIIALLEK